MSMRQGNIRLALKNIKHTRGRSYATMLGIIIGVMAVVLVVSIGQGVKMQIANQLGRYGKGTITVQPYVPASASGIFSGLSNQTTSLLSGNDLQVVQKTHGVDVAVPLSSSAGVMRGDHTLQAPFVVATTANLPRVIKQHIQYGGFFDPTVDDKAVVLGASVAHQLFDDNAPLGQTLTWRGQHFRVAGVFSSFNAPPFSLEANFNNAVFVPYSTAQSLSGSVLGSYQIIAKVSTHADVAQVAHTVRSALVATHGGAADVTVLRSDQNDVAANRTIHLLTLLVVGAAIIALVVGGVGIMNVMLVSVTERMHEIGVRKAIGATNRQIMSQFMSEALVLSATGAVIADILSAGAIGLMRLYTSLQPVIVWQIMVVAPVLAIAIGLFFGSVPALKAARKDPIEALRHE
ncbi:MAG TPA: ABC transporter permease [Candidatus Saccharimonadales bacterium]|nr:ABC transporter permease [Candidatus Saccharimonadales bacterium]